MCCTRIFLAAALITVVTANAECPGGQCRDDRYVNGEYDEASLLQTQLATKQTPVTDANRSSSTLSVKVALTGDSGNKEVSEDASSKAKGDAAAAVDKQAWADFGDHVDKVIDHVGDHVDNVKDAVSKATGIDVEKMLNHENTGDAVDHVKDQISKATGLDLGDPNVVANIKDQISKATGVDVGNMLDPNCYELPDKCVQSFTYNGKKYTGCTQQGSAFFWCSWKEDYEDGKYSHCEYKAPASGKCLAPTVKPNGAHKAASIGGGLIMLLIANLTGAAK